MLLIGIGGDHNNKVTVTTLNKFMPGSKHSDKQRKAEQQQADERMHDVLLLLEHLAESEETTIKMIMGCLYDVGSINFINNKFRFKPLNRLMKAIASMSKPIFKFVALRWFRQQCPPLIANWLRSKVSFKPEKKSPPAPRPTVVQPHAQSTTQSPATAQPISITQSLPAIQPASGVQPLSTAQFTSTAQTTLPLLNESAAQEIKHLRTQIRVLTGMLAGTLIALGGTVAWQFNILNTERIQPIQQFQSTTTAEPVEPVEPPKH